MIGTTSGLMRCSITPCPGPHSQPTALHSTTAAVQARPSMPRVFCLASMAGAPAARSNQQLDAMLRARPLLLPPNDHPQPPTERNADQMCHPPIRIVCELLWHLGWVIGPVEFEGTRTRRALGGTASSTPKEQAAHLRWRGGWDGGMMWAAIRYIANSALASVPLFHPDRAPEPPCPLDRD